MGVGAVLHWREGVVGGETEGNHPAALPGLSGHGNEMEVWNPDDPE